MSDPRQGLPSASTAYRRRRCPGSRLAEKDIPEPPTSDIAEAGTRIHKAFETGDLTFCDDLEEQRIAQNLLDLAEAAVGDWRIHHELVGYRGTGPEVEEVFREKRLWIHHPQTGEKLESAQLDQYRIFRDHCLILDAKSGFHAAPPSPKNYQLRVQMLDVWLNHPHINHFRVGIVQARIGASYNYVDYTINDARYALSEFLLADHLSRQDDAPRDAGDWCNYCKAKPYCSTAGIYAMMSRNYLEQTAGAIVGTDDVLLKVIQLPLASLAYIEERRSLAEKVFEAVKDRLKGFSKEELATVGLTKTDDTEISEVTDVPKARSILVPKYIDETQFWTCVKLALGTVTKLVQKTYAKQQKITQKKAAELLREDLQSTITKTKRAGYITALPKQNEQPVIEDNKP